MSNITPIVLDVAAAPLALELCAIVALEKRDTPAGTPVVDRVGGEALQIAMRLRSRTNPQALAVARLLNLGSLALNQLEANHACNSTDLRTLFARAVLAYLERQGMDSDQVADAMDELVQAQDTVRLLSAIPE